MRLESAGGAGQPVALRLYVDGKLAAEASDPAALGPGTAGIIAVAEGSGGAQVIFDNFAVTEA